MKIPVVLPDLHGEIEQRRNSRDGRNQFTVAQHCNITFLAPGYKGDRLTAVAQERYFAGRSGIYDCTVTNQDAVVVAEMRGHSRTVKGTHLRGVMWTAAHE